MTRIRGVKIVKSLTNPLAFLFGEVKTLKIDALLLYENKLTRLIGVNDQKVKHSTISLFQEFIS